MSLWTLFNNLICLIPFSICLGEYGETLRLLCLEVDAKHKDQQPVETHVSMILNAEKCTRQKGQQCDIIQVTVNMTEKIQHLLSSRKEILALLGVRRYLLMDKDSSDFSLSGNADTLIH